MPETKVTPESLADLLAHDAADVEDDEVSPIDLAAVRGERIETLADSLRAAWVEVERLQVDRDNIETQAQAAYRIFGDKVSAVAVELAAARAAIERVLVLADKYEAEKAQGQRRLFSVAAVVTAIRAAVRGTSDE